MKWDENGISVCEHHHFILHSFNPISLESLTGSFFRAAVPVDITQGSPNPSLWGVPSATLANTSCNIEQFFSNHSIIFGKYNLFPIIFLSNDRARHNRYHLLRYDPFS